MSNSLYREKITHVFIDWHGILGIRGFWCEQVKIDKRLESWCHSIFSNQAVVNDWMRGKIKLEFLLKEAKNFGISPDEILDAFDKDKPHYGPNLVLLDCLDRLFPASQKILITDNMDIFKNRILAPDFKLSAYFDSTFISCDYNCLKLDAAPNLFDLATKELGLSDFSNCVLIDDSRSNTEYFKQKKGHFFLIK